MVDEVHRYRLGNEPKLDPVPSVSGQKVAIDVILGGGQYRIEFRFVSQSVPVNLVHQTMHAGIDYGMSPRRLADAIVKGAIVVDSRETVVEINSSASSTPSSGR